METFDYSYSDMCRICEKGKNLTNIFCPTKKHVLKKLRACADITLDNNDLLPKFICEKCENNLEFAYKFKIQCEYTDRKFRDILLELKKEESIKNIGMKTIDFSENNSIYEVSDIYNDCDDEIVILSKDSIENDSNQSSEELLENNITTNEEIDLKEKDYNYIKDEIIFQSEEEEEIIEEEDIKIDFDENDVEFVETLDMSGDEYEDVVLNENIIEDVNENEIIDDENQQNISEETQENENEENANEITKISKGKTKKTYNCETCGTHLNTYSDYKNHLKSHGSSRYACTLCSRIFTKRYHLKNHMITHTKETKFKCQQCNKIYTNHGNLDRHIRVVHKNEKHFVCTTCGKGFAQLSTLRYHNSVHIKDRQFECDECDKKFKTQEHLNLHKDRHLPKELRKVKPYKALKRHKPQIKICICSYCGKKSNTLALHQSHTRTHTGEKPFQCSVCQKSFAFQQSLRTHLLLHTGEKPFKCEYCGLTFRQIGHLKGHKLVHTGLKLHVCTICDKSFALRGNLTVHLRLHTGETPFHCDLCPKKFYDNNGLKRHKKTHNKHVLNEETKDNATKEMELNDFDNDISFASIIQSDIQ